MTINASPCSARTPRNRDPKSMSLVIPCYNEEEVLPELYRRLKELVSGYTFPIEVLLIDDGSKDSTWQMICSYAQGSCFINAWGSPFLRSFLLLLFTASLNRLPDLRCLVIQEIFA